MEYYNYYCTGCEQVITRKEPMKVSYCTTHDKLVKLKYITPEEAKDLKYLLRQTKK